MSGTIDIHVRINYIRVLQDCLICVTYDCGSKAGENTGHAGAIVRALFLYVCNVVVLRPFERGGKDAANFPWTI